MLNSKSNVRNIGDILGKNPSAFTFQDPPLIDAPHTTILQLNGNPRQIPDPSKTLRPAMGVERILIKSLALKKDEKGSSGQLVWEPDSKETRVRFVGSWISDHSTLGQHQLTSTANDYVEISFFGTGLNLVLFVDGTSRDLRATIDNGAEGGNFYVTGSNIISNRQYPSNIIVSVASNLSLGNHTIKIRQNTGSTNFRIFGFEILNQSTQIKIPQGEIYANGLKYTNSALQSIDYNTGFDGNPVLNGRGGRVVEYITPQGRIGKVIQQTNAAQQNLTSADHTNEEIIRKINFREFGVNAVSDFSTLADTVTNRAFTLDDGTTSLYGRDVRVFTSGGTLGSFPGVYTNTTGAPGGIELTFIGTGLDYIVNFGNSAETITIYVNGVSIGTIPYENTIKNKLIKVVSGLPYGSHMVRLERGGGGSDFMNISDFIIYGPKKPSIPTNSQEINDYFLMANFSAVATTKVLSTGTMFKSSLREHVYTGTYEAVEISGVGDFSGINVRNNAGTGETLALTFFGTGAEIFARGGSSGATFTITVDGVAYTGAATAVSGGSWTPGTSTWVTSTVEGCKLILSGLSLGLHTIRLTNTANPGQMAYQGMSVITPIHYPNTKVGSLSMGPAVQLKTSEDVAGIDLSKAKAWLVFNMIDSVIRSSYNIAGVIKVSTGRCIVYFEKPFKNKNFVAVTSAREQVQAIFNNGLSQDNPRTNSVELFTATNAGTEQSVDYVALLCFGELQDEE